MWRGRSKLNTALETMFSGLKKTCALDHLDTYYLDGQGRNVIIIIILLS